jgi:hypothetical protein
VILICSFGKLVGYCTGLRSYGIMRFLGFDVVGSIKFDLGKILGSFRHHYYIVFFVLLKSECILFIRFQL